MNKELIKKYQKEFISWVNDAELLIKGSNGWITVGDDFNWDESTDSIIVLKDKYSEFRIALAEGKIVEVAVNHNDVDGYIWERVEDDDFHSFHIDEIRIKPDYLKSSDNLKFKVGDIAIHNGKFRKISKVIDGMLDCFTDGPAVIMKNDTLEIWKPKVGESCLFSNKDEEPVIGTFLEMFNGDLYVMAADKINTFEFCEPINK